MTEEKHFLSLRHHAANF